MSHIANFSCGAASAVATKMTIASHADVLVVRAFIEEEHEDNHRFAADCERWFGKQIMLLRDRKYGASTIREDFPDRFVQISKLQQELGEGAYFLRFRSGPREGQRMSLLELPPGRGNMAEDADFSCSHLCEAAERILATAS